MGRVVSAFGVQGWLKIKPHSAQPDVLLATDAWWLGPSAASAPDFRPVAVQNSRMHAAYVLAQLEGVSDRDAAHALKSQAVWVSRAAFPQPQAQAWYWVDLIGCQLYGEAGAGENAQPALLGTVVEVSDNGAHAVLHVRKDIPAHKAPVTLIPFVAAHVLAVDVDAKRIDTNWPLDF